MRGRGSDRAVDAKIERFLADERVRERLRERAWLDRITAEEVADILGVSAQRVYQLTSGHPQFPEPLPVGARWSRVEVEEFRAVWARDPGRRAGE